jgi:molybdopterin converting factor small subunit
MRVSVELFGIPRLRAGVSKTEAVGSNLGDLLCDLAQRYPALAEACISGRQLKAGFTANISGAQFVTNPETELKEGDSLLLLSMDAGG